MDKIIHTRVLLIACDPMALSRAVLDSLIPTDNFNYEASMDIMWTRAIANLSNLTPTSKGVYILHSRFRIGGRNGSIGSSSMDYDG